MKKKSSTVPVNRIIPENEQNQEIAESKVKTCQCASCLKLIEPYKNGVKLSGSKLGICYECMERLLSVNKQIEESKAKNKHLEELRLKGPVTRIPSEHYIKHIVPTPKVKKEEVWLKAWLAMANGGNLPQPSRRLDSYSNFAIYADECVTDYFIRFGDDND